jgi:hypothetical protein
VANGRTVDDVNNRPETRGRRKEPTCMQNLMGSCHLAKGKDRHTFRNGGLPGGRGEPCAAWLLAVGAGPTGDASVRLVAIEQLMRVACRMR